jgi:hypothetical protein
MPPQGLSHEAADWTVGTLYLFVSSMFRETDMRYDQRHGALLESIAAALLSTKEAIVKAESASDKRYQSLNELRGAMSDLVSNMMSKSEGAATFKGHADKLDGLAASIQVSNLALENRVKREDLKELKEEVAKLSEKISGVLISIATDVQATSKYAQNTSAVVAVVISFLALLAAGYSALHPGVPQVYLTAPAAEPEPATPLVRKP